MYRHHSQRIYFKDKNHELAIRTGNQLLCTSEYRTDASWISVWWPLSYTSSLYWMDTRIVYIWMWYMCISLSTMHGIAIVTSDFASDMMIIANIPSEICMIPIRLMCQMSIHIRNISVTSAPALMASSCDRSNLIMFLDIISFWTTILWWIQQWMQ